MQKKKKLYIAIIIISTVILIADIAVFFITKPSMGDFGGGSRPSFSGSEMPEDFGDMFGGEMPEGFEDFFNGQMPEGFPGGNFPGSSSEGGSTSGFTSGQMPSGFPGGQMPGGFPGGEMPEGFEDMFGGEMPEGFDGFNRGEMPNGNMQMPGGASKLRLLCIPIAIVCVIVDIVFGILLFRLAKKTPKKKDEPAKAEIEGPIDPVAQRLAKKKKQQNITVVVLAFLLVGVLVLQLLSSGANVAQSALEVNEKVIQAQVEKGLVQKYLRSGGVLSSVEDIEISVPGNVKITKYLVANGENVKAGDAIAVVDKNSVMAAIADIQELMEELDDDMTDAMDDSISGKITASVKGTVVVVYGEVNEDVVDVMYDHGALALVSLDGLLALELDKVGEYTVGDELVVTDADGNQKEGHVASIGKDTFEVTVSMDDFAYEEEVTVSDAEGTELGKGKLDIYSQQKITGYFGTISNVYISDGDTISVGETFFKLKNTDYSATYQVLLSKRLVLEEQYNKLVAMGSSGYIYAEQDGSISGIDTSVATVASVSAMGGSSSEVVPPEGDVPEQTVPEQTTPEEGAKISKTLHVIWMNSDGTLQMAGFPEKLVVKLMANGAVVGTAELTATNNWSYTWSELAQFEGDKAINYTIVAEESFVGYKSVTKVIGSITLMLNTSASAGAPSTDMPSGSYPSGGISGGMTGNVSGGMPGMDGGFVQEDPTYVFEETVICYLSPNDTVDVEITIDELDINRIKAGQTCEVTLDAFSGQSFEAVVQGINQEGENSGGNTKYTVVVCMDKQEDMLLGMNASVKISLESAENVLMIPEAALVENEDGVFVYTKYSEKSDELSGLVEVTTGLSDGENVQILSGLESGQDFYYRYADTILFVNNRR